MVTGDGQTGDEQTRSVREYQSELECMTLLIARAGIASSHTACSATVMTRHKGQLLRSWLSMGWL
jgi:hypothetical protein